MEVSRPATSASRDRRLARSSALSRTTMSRGVDAEVDGDVRLDEEDVVPALDALGRDGEPGETADGVGAGLVAALAVAQLADELLGLGEQHGAGVGAGGVDVCRRVSMRNLSPRVSVRWSSDGA